MNTWWGRSSIGSGQVDSRTPAAFWRKPSNSSHDGGRGSERPPAELEHRLDEHALEGVADAGPGQVDEVERQGGEAARRGAT